MASKIKVDEIAGSTGSTVTVPTGQTLTITDGLAASTIASGTLADARIPNLSATKITTGELANARVADLPASKITTGTLANARVADLPASKTTSGTFADARISASSVNQHAATFDDNKIVSDIAQLALHQSINENKAAYSLQNTFVDTFQDATGLDALTTCNRDGTGEFIASATSGTGDDANTVMMLHFNTAPGATIVDSSLNSGDITLTKQGSGDTDATQKKFGSYSWHNEQATADYLKSNDLSTGMTNAFPTTGDFTIDFWAYQSTREDSNRVFSVGNTGTPASGSTPWMTWANNSSDVNLHSSLGAFSPPISGNPHVATGAWHHYAVQRTGAKIHLYFQGKIYWIVSNQENWDGENFVGLGGKDIWLGTRSASPGNTEHWRGYIDEFRVSKVARYASTAADNTTVFTPEVAAYTASSVNATGNFTSVNTVANASTTSASLIVLYTDHLGTNALNTDIIGAVSANGGSNYSTVTLAAKQNFSTGIKMAVANDVAVTAGTSMKYKINFANQSGAKQARINGVALLY